MSFGQIYNRSIAQSAHENAHDISRIGGYTYLLMGSTDLDATRSYYGVAKMDDLGNMVGFDTLVLSSATSPYPLSVLSSSIYKLPDSTFYVYGSYVDGCDVIYEAGSFVIHYNGNLNKLNQKLFPDSLNAFNKVGILSLGAGEYALTIPTSVFGFDSALTQTFFHQWSGDYLQGAVSLPNNLIMEVSKSFITNLNSTYLYNTTTNITSPGPQMDGLVYDANDTVFARIDGGVIYMHHKSNLLAYDSINIAAVTGFSHDKVWFQKDVVLLANLKNYAVVSMDNLQLVKADSIQTQCDFIKYEGFFSYQDSILATATQLRNSRFQIESFNIYKPKAPAFSDVELTVKNTRMEVGSIFEHAPNVRTVYSDNDWKITVVNLGQDTIKEMALKHYVADNPYCLPYVSLILKENLSLAPLDTLIIELDSISHVSTIFSTTYISRINVAVVMVNKNIVKSNHWGGGSATVLNVDIDEEELKQEAFNVFPNPTSGIVNLEFLNNFDGTIELYSLSGKLLEVRNVITKEGEKYSLNLLGYPTGVYIIQAESDDIRFQKQIIKN
tara:strand:- start:583 stop:2244 length:1662 start_codon:yes stop_codon:yes gene_type:complete